MGRPTKTKINQILEQIKSRYTIEKGVIAQLIRDHAPNTKRFSTWINKAYEIEDKLVNLVKVTVVTTEKTTKLVVVNTPVISDLVDILGKKERMIKQDLKDMNIPFEVLKTLAIELKKKEIKGKLSKTGTHISKFKNTKEMIEKVEIFRKYHNHYCSKSKTKCKYAKTTLALIRKIMEDLNINVKQLTEFSNEEEFRSLIDKIKNYWREKELDDNTINSYSAHLRTFFGYIGVNVSWIKKYLETHRYKGKYGKIAWLDDQDLLDVFRELKNMYDKGEISYETWRKVIAGIVAQHELGCRIQGLETMRFTIIREKYEVNGEKKEITIYTTITKEKKGKDWERPIKPEYYDMIRKWLPFSKDDSNMYVTILREIYFRIITRRGIAKEKDKDKIIELAKRGQIDKIEEIIGDRKWAYALVHPSHILRHTSVHHWGREIGRDIAFINAMTHEDPGIYVNVYGSLSIIELAGLIYKLPGIRRDHDEVLKKAKQLGLI